MSDDERAGAGLADKVRQAFESSSNPRVLAFAGEIFSAEDVTRGVSELNFLLKELGVADGAPVALIARNRPAHIIAFYAAIAGQRNLAMVYPFQSTAGKAEHLEQIGSAAAIASADDWGPELVDTCTRLGIAGIMIPEGKGANFRRATIQGASNAFGRAGRLPAGIQILSSGTTGPPKRNQLPLRVLTRVTDGMPVGDKQKADEDILAWPLGGVGGTMIALSALVMRRPLNVLERFSVEDWVSIVKDRQVQATGVNPTMIRMILDARVPKQDLASLKVVSGGSAALNPELEKEFESGYDISVIWAYGATEFCGTAFSWTLDLKARYAEAKRGSVGRPLPGVEGRIVDPESGRVLPPNQEGLIEAFIPVVSNQWIRTNDIGVLDEDGFLYLKGRADGAINRGGFKILPEAIVETLRKHPAVFDAAVIGLPDPRLGQVPHAVIELRKSAPRLDEAEIFDFLRQHLSAPQIPARIHLMAALPRTPSQKISLAQVREFIVSTVEAAQPDRGGN